MDEQYCKCITSTAVYIEHDDFGYWDCCDDCKKKIEDGFHYYDEPELY